MRSMRSGNHVLKEKDLWPPFPHPWRQQPWTLLHPWAQNGPLPFFSPRLSRTAFLLGFALIFVEGRQLSCIASRLSIRLERHRRTRSSMTPPSHDSSPCNPEECSLAAFPSPLQAAAMNSPSPLGLDVLSEALMLPPCSWILASSTQSSSQQRGTRPG